MVTKEIDIRKINPNQARVDVDIVVCALPALAPKVSRSIIFEGRDDFVLLLT
jgi:hypothetical protein